MALQTEELLRGSEAASVGLRVLEDSLHDLGADWGEVLDEMKQANDEMVQSHKLT